MHFDGLNCEAMILLKLLRRVEQCVTVFPNGLEHEFAALPESSLCVDNAGRGAIVSLPTAGGWQGGRHFLDVIKLSRVIRSVHLPRVFPIDYCAIFILVKILVIVLL